METCRLQTNHDVFKSFDSKRPSTEVYKSWKRPSKTFRKEEMKKRFLGTIKRKGNQTKGILPKMFLLKIN